MGSNVLYPDPLDKGYQISWLPETNLPYPYTYRVLIRDGDTGELVTPNDTDTHWAEYPDPIEDALLYDDVSRSLVTTTELTARINIPLLLTRNGGKYGLYLLSIHQYTTAESELTEREQSAYLYIIENGLKPPSFK